MNRSIVVGVICALSSSAVSSLAWEGDDIPALFFARDRGQIPRSVQILQPYGNLDSSRTRNALLVAEAVRARVGERWVASALKITKIESNYRCNAVNRKSGATGLGQLMFYSARALEPGSEYHRDDCETGARLIALHMQACLSAGVTNEAEMAKCHVAGIRGWNHRLARWAERYKASYSRMVSGAHPVQLADASGWIVRGTISIFR